MEKKGNLRYQVVSGLVWRFGERIAAQIVSLVVSIILARLLAPSDYGAVTLVMIFITFADVFVTNGLGSALIQKEAPDDLDFSSVFYVNLVLSIGLYIIIFILAFMRIFRSFSKLNRRIFVKTSTYQTTSWIYVRVCIYGRWTWLCARIWKNNRINWD